jgi:hypothetical protein
MFQPSRHYCLHHRILPPLRRQCDPPQQQGTESARGEFGPSQGGSVRDRTPGVCPRDGLVIGVVFRATCSRWAHPYLWNLKPQLCESILVSRSDNQRHV